MTLLPRRPDDLAAAALCIEYALGLPGVSFMRRDDIARFWLANHPPAERR